MPYTFIETQTAPSAKALLAPLRHGTLLHGSYSASLVAYGDGFVRRTKCVDGFSRIKELDVHRVVLAYRLDRLWKSIISDLATKGFLQGDYLKNLSCETAPKLK
jgi:hypothetical protein